MDQGIQIGRKEVKVSLFAHGMIVYLIGPKNPTRELLKLIKKKKQFFKAISKVVGYKINSNKSVVALLYSKDKQAEKEIGEMTPFTIVTNNIKYLGVTN